MYVRLRMSVPELIQYTCVYLIKLGPGNHCVAIVVSKVGLVEYLLGQEVLVVLVQIVFGANLRREFTV